MRLLIENAKDTTAAKVIAARRAELNGNHEEQPPLLQ